MRLPAWAYLNVLSALVSAFGVFGNLLVGDWFSVLMFTALLLAQIQVVSLVREVHK